jgi:hypothetical protein
MPISSKIEMTDEYDRLALDYNTFFSVLEPAVLADKQMKLRVLITPKGTMANSQLTLQLCLKAGRTLETCTGRKLLLDATKINLGPADIGGWIHYPCWKLKTEAPVRLIWPVYPYNPYGDAPETSLDHAVAALSVPLRTIGPEDSSEPAHSTEVSVDIETE